MDAPKLGNGALNTRSHPDAGIPPHHNLEEGRKFVIKVRLGTVSSQPSTQDASAAGAGSVTGNSKCSMRA